MQEEISDPAPSTGMDSTAAVETALLLKSLRRCGERENATESKRTLAAVRLEAPSRGPVIYAAEARYLEELSKSGMNPAEYATAMQRRRN